MTERKGFPEHLLTVETLRELGFPVRVVEKSMGMVTHATEGTTWAKAVDAAKVAGVVRWSTSAEWAEAVEARKAKAAARRVCRVEAGVVAFLKAGSVTLGA